MKMWRHGDVLIVKVDSIPAEAERLPGNILAKGEATGHAHRVVGRGKVGIWRQGTLNFLRVDEAPADVVHEEHKTITLEPGTYRFWMQREYSPKEIRRVID
jgi:hypothetical protein